MLHRSKEPLTHNTRIVVILLISIRLQQRVRVPIAPPLLQLRIAPQHVHHLLHDPQHALLLEPPPHDLQWDRRARVLLRSLFALRVEGLVPPVHLAEGLLAGPGVPVPGVGLQDGAGGEDGGGEVERVEDGGVPPVAALVVRGRGGGVDGGEEGVDARLAQLLGVCGAQLISCQVDGPAFFQSVDFTADVGERPLEEGDDGLVALADRVAVLLAAVEEVGLVDGVDERRVQRRVEVDDGVSRAAQRGDGVAQRAGDRWMRVDDAVVPDDADAQLLGDVEVAVAGVALPGDLDEGGLVVPGTVGQRDAAEEPQVRDAGGHRTDDADDVLHARVQAGEPAVWEPRDAGLQAVDAAEAAGDADRAACRRHLACISTHVCICPVQ